jgi:hypothetical protein
MRRAVVVQARQKVGAAYTTATYEETAFLGDGTPGNLRIFWWD